MKKKIVGVFFIIVIMLMVLGCEEKTNQAKKDNKDEKVFIKPDIKANISTDPVGASLYLQIVSAIPEVKTTNRYYLGQSPYKEVRTWQVPGLTKANADKVVLVLFISKFGYEDVVKSLPLASVLKEDELNYSLKLKMKNDRVSKQIRKNSKANKINPMLPHQTKVLDPKMFLRKEIPRSQKDKKAKAIKEKRLEEKPKQLAKDPFEPNNTPKQAKAINLNRYYVAKMDNNKDKDHYMVFLGNKPNYTLTLDQLSPDSKYKLEVYIHPSPSRKVYQLISSKNEASLNINLAEKKRPTGIYGIRISRLSGSSSQYRFKIDVKSKKRDFSKSKKAKSNKKKNNKITGKSHAVKKQS